jgi:hypothetical protein
MLTAEHTKPKGALSATIGTTWRITSLERRASAIVAHDGRENHHGSGLLIGLALPISDLDRWHVK